MKHETFDVLTKFQSFELFVGHGGASHKRIKANLCIYQSASPPGVQWRSQNVEKVTHNKERLLNEVIFFNCATFQSENFS